MPETAGVWNFFGAVRGPYYIVILTSLCDDLVVENLNWPAEWLRGVLTPAVLSVVSDGQTYGYLIAQRLADAGLGTVKGGTLYPLLARLEQDGDVISTWREGQGGPGRKYYSITPGGRQHLAALRADWQVFANRSTAVITGRKEHS